MGTIKYTVLGRFWYRDDDSYVDIQLRKYANNWYRVYHRYDSYITMKEFNDFRDAFYFYESECESHM